MICGNREVINVALGMTQYGCSRCSTGKLIADTATGTPMHPCAGLGGMAVPLVPAGTRSDARLVVREDYIGAEDVQRDRDGRVWSGVRVTTDDTEHVAVYAPTAHANQRG